MSGINYDSVQCGVGPVRFVGFELVRMMEKTATLPLTTLQSILKHDTTLKYFVH